MMDDQAFQQIMAELRELRLLYMTLVDKLVPVDDAFEDEAEAIESEDEFVDEDELLKALKQLFSLRIKKKQLRSIERLTEKQKKAVRDSLLVLKQDPVPVKRYNVVKLRDYSNMYRLRLGVIRVVYSIDWNKKNIDIQFIGKRSQAYKR